MKKLLVILLLIANIAGVYGQDYSKGILKLEVITTAGDTRTGSAIAVGKFGDIHYFITARHLVFGQESEEGSLFDQQSPYKSVQLQERHRPSRRYEARVGKSFEELGDIVVLEVSNLVLSPFKHKFGRAKKLKSGKKLTVIGYPDGEYMPNSLNQVIAPNVGVVGNELRLSKSGLGVGYSGGGVFKGNSNELMGMMVGGEGNLGAQALRMDKIVPFLNREGIPTNLIDFTKRNPVTFGLIAASAGAIVFERLRTLTQIRPVRDEVGRINRLDGDDNIQPNALISVDGKFTGTAEEAQQWINDWASQQWIPFVGAVTLLGSAMLTESLTTEKQKRIQRGEID